MATAIITRFAGCDFEFECDKKWDQFTPTDAANVRRCDRCKKAVTMCVDEDEFQRLAEMGSCVAIYVKEALMEKFTVGIPRRSAKQAAFIDSLGTLDPEPQITKSKPENSFTGAALSDRDEVSPAEKVTISQRQQEFLRRREAAMQAVKSGEPVRSGLISQDKFQGPDSSSNTYLQ